MLNKLIYIFVFFIPFSSFSQIDSVAIQQDSLKWDIDTTLTIEEVVKFDNDKINNLIALKSFFDKLYSLEKGNINKIRIVQIGDSHIQADLFTAKMRFLYQKKYGNAGFGFTFPYSLAKTNNSAPIIYKGSGSFYSKRNLFASENEPIGLSGISLINQSKNNSFELNSKDSQYNFNYIKIITPNNKAYFEYGFNYKIETHLIEKPKKITHKIKPGEVLGSIANKYDITVSQLKKANGLKSDNIRDGKILNIPSKTKVQKTVSKKVFDASPFVKDSLFSYAYFNDAVSKIGISQNQEEEKGILNGLILENNKNGITYSGIGVNGAKLSDYLKFDLFFEQTPILEADLFIISLGTNESFDLLSNESYKLNLEKTVTKLREKNPNSCFLITTPPPSLLHRKKPNTFIQNYSNSIKEMSSNLNFASWDLLEVFGGIYNIKNIYKKGYMAGDKVHYSKKGYEKQAELLFLALESAYENYKLNSK